MKAGDIEDFSLPLNTGKAKKMKVSAEVRRTLNYIITLADPE